MTRKLVTKADPEVGTLTLTVPVPPSLNNAYATFKGRRLLSREGRAFKEEVGIEVLFEQRRRIVANVGRWQYSKGDRLSLTLELSFPNNRRHDLDNTVKLTSDALSAALGFDDCVVDVLHVERKENDKVSPRCVVTLKVL
jgi:crossover junction endodeoxyribonuclease RusA